ncbi:MAG: LysR family transcriptional regulator, partial [Cupriavidus sp.]|nr:LysR family transcriptional regulator [Cupriavidus sp.]
KVISRAGSRQPMHAVVGPGFPLVGSGDAVTLRDLMPYPIALAYPSYGTRQLVDAAMLLDKVRLVPAITTNSIAVLKQFAKTGAGFTLLAPLAVAPELESGELVAIPVDNPILQRPETHVVTRIGRMLSPAANRLLQMLCRRMQQYPSHVA